MLRPNIVNSIGPTTHPLSLAKSAVVDARSPADVHVRVPEKTQFAMGYAPGLGLQGATKDCCADLVGVAALHAFQFPILSGAEPVEHIVENAFRWQGSVQEFLYALQVALACMNISKRYAAPNCCFKRV